MQPSSLSVPPGMTISPDDSRRGSESAEHAQEKGQEIWNDGERASFEARKRSSPCRKMPNSAASHARQPTNSAPSALSPQPWLFVEEAHSVRA